MEIIYLPRFTREFKKLPKDVKAAAYEKEQWFRLDPFNARLKTHKLHGALEGFWACSITYHVRLIFDFHDKHTVRFYSIGSHDIYE